MAEIEKVPVTQTGDEGKDLSQGIKKEERTPEEIARYNLKKRVDEAKALGIDPKKLLGDDPEDETPPAWYVKEKQKEIKQSALQLAEGITDADLKKIVISNLNRLVPSDNPEEDFRMALGAASASKNKQVLEEMNRYSKPRVTASGGGQPLKPAEEEFTPTEAESRLMQPPYNLTKEKIIAARPK